MKRTIRYPEYFENFECIGSGCEDSCCHQWKIIIDQATYHRYQKISDLELREIIGNYLKLKSPQQTAADYGYIKLDAERRCPFLNSDNLCRLQGKMGVSALSQTCLTYPRIFNNVNGFLEGSAEISCPEVARLVVLNRKGIAIKTGMLELDERFRVQVDLKLNEDYKANPLSEYFFIVRSFAIDLLQNRDLPLNDRLVVLGMLSQKTQSLLAAGNSAEIPALLNLFNQQLSGDTLSADLAQIPTSPSIQMSLLKELADRKIARGSGIVAYSECHQQFLMGIGYHSENNNNELTKGYKNAYDRYYQPFMVDNEYMLENYCINYLFKTLFPYTGPDKPAPFEAYVAMILNYAMLKMYLIGHAGYYKELNTQIVIKMIYSFAKAIEHDSTYLETITDALQKNGINSLGHMAILIKN